MRKKFIAQTSNLEIHGLTYQVQKCLNLRGFSICAQSCRTMNLIARNFYFYDSFDSFELCCRFVLLELQLVKVKRTLEKVAIINDELPLKAARRDAIANLRLF